ncbi:hypothetical protein ABFV99_00445 [Cytobacillus horneckiae]|uniref:hypothetical protein n=1 Tax=Cytobacillus horneckiae TaxID=549687 RepID=UPI0034CD315B
MRKLLTTSLLSFFVIFGFAITQASASDNKDLLDEVREITEGTNVEVIDVNELPAGTEFVEFDSVEDFEKALKSQEDLLNNDVEFSQDSPAIQPMATSSVGSIKWVTYKWWDPTKPVNMTINFNYTYTGSGSSKLFQSVSNIKSHSTGFPTNWVQTNASHRLLDAKRTISITITGYHLFGASIGGQPIGYKADATYIREFYR